jgi:RES domain-containing protein
VAAAIVLKPEDHVGWDAIPPGRVSLDVGDQWSALLSSVLLIVPSVIVPEDRNILVNPAHPHGARLQARKLRRWTYDPRL